MRLGGSPLRYCDGYWNDALLLSVSEIHQKSLGNLKSTIQNYIHIEHQCQAHSIRQDEGLKMETSTKNKRCNFRSFTRVV